MAEQRLYLLYISQSFQSLVKAAVDGTYNDPFFENAKTELGYQKRIHAVMQNLSHQSCIDSWVKYTTPYLSPVVVLETECYCALELVFVIFSAQWKGRSNESPPTSCQRVVFRSLYSVPDQIWAPSCLSSPNRLDSPLPRQLGTSHLCVCVSIHPHGA